MTLLIRLAGGALLALATLAGVATSAWGYWTGTGAGTGSATTATLAPPTDVTAGVLPGGASVHVSWAAPTAGVAPQGYTVVRVRESDDEPAPACGGAIVTGTGCTDVPEAGTYHYLVTAVLGSWTATGPPSDAVSVNDDATPPSVTVTHVNGESQDFPFMTNVVTSFGGTCGTDDGDSATVAALVDDSAASPATTECSAGTWSLTLTTPLSAEGTYALSARQSDSAGNTGSAPAEEVIVDAAPTVTAVSSPSADGSYRAGTVIPITITFSERVTVTGAPTLALAIGAPSTAQYASSSGPTELTFTYAVAAGDTSADLDYAATDALSADSGTIRDSMGNDAVLTLPAPGTPGSLASTKDLVIDTTAPSVALTTVNGTSPTAFPHSTNADVTSIGGSCGSAAGDQAVSLLVGGSALSTTACTAGTWTVTLDPAWSTEGTRSLSARQDDLAGNSSATTGAELTIDRTPPTLLSIVRAGSSPTVSSGALSWTVTFSEPVLAVTVSSFALATSALTGAVPELASATCTNGAAPCATWTVATGEVTGLNGTIGLDLATAGSVTDAALNELSTASFSGEAYTVDTVSPVVTITAITRIGGSGKVRVTGTGEPGLPLTLTLCFSTTSTAPCGADKQVFTITLTGSTWQSPNSAARGPGWWWATAMQTDAAGNVGSAPLGPVAN